MIGTNSVYYKFLDAEGNYVSSNDVTNACFSAVTLREIPTKVVTVHVWIPKEYVPYNDDEVKQWFDLLNQWEFPIRELKYNDKQYDFFIDIDAYKNKIHISSALILGNAYVHYRW